MGPSVSIASTPVWTVIDFFPCDALRPIGQPICDLSFSVTLGVRSSESQGLATAHDSGAEGGIGYGSVINPAKKSKR
jgi:hypothetical protein